MIRVVHDAVDAARGATAAQSHSLGHRMLNTHVRVENPNAIPARTVSIFEWNDPVLAQANG